jgi:FKBP-type peptidyl-prolyl cis-trans isomerase SlyD
VIPTKPDLVTKDVVVSMAYELSVDGKIEEAYNDSDPIVFIYGHENIIPGLENQIRDMKIGDNKDITVPAADAYGEVVEEAIIDVPREQFPANIPLQIGTILEVKDEQGNPMTAHISAVTDELITLDFNHPMAGKTLNFKIKIIDLRAGKAEEIKAGQVLDD